MGGKTYSTGPEHFLKRPEGKVHVEHIEGLLIFVLEALRISLLKVRKHLPASLKPVVLLQSHLIGNDNFSTPNERAHHVEPGSGIIDHLRIDIGWRGKIGGIFPAHILLKRARERG